MVQPRSVNPANQFMPGGKSGANSAGNPKYWIKIVVIGDSFVGKTSLIQQFVHSKFTENFKATIGADFTNKQLQLEDGDGYA